MKEDEVDLIEINGEYAQRRDAKLAREREIADYLRRCQSNPANMAMDIRKDVTEKFGISLYAYYKIVNKINDGEL
ncbi:MAG: hypothetical protein LIO91_03485 [Bacteroidales bacterium]|nr:hypothetical protein [Bacteroidales bacterium]